MDLLNTTFSRIRIETLDNRVSETLAKLAQAGQFRALVIESKGSQVLLDTAFGQIKGTVAQPLTKGDEILARLLPGKDMPAIKIESIQTARLELPAKILTQLLQITSQSNPESPLRAQIIKVLSQSPEQTLIRYAGKTYAIPAQPKLQAGDTLLLKPASNNKTELLRLQPENVLRNALSQLISRSESAHQNNALIKLQQLLETLPGLKPADIPELPAVSKKEQTLPAQNNEIKKELPPRELLTQLRSLARPLGRLAELNADSLRQIFSLLTLLKPARPVSVANPSSLPELLNRLQAALNSSPQNFTLLLRQLIEAHSSRLPQKLPDALSSDLVESLKADIQNQVEQTLNQLHTQKTTLRLQQEQQLPIQLNLNLPIQDDDKTTALKLNIKQHKNNTSSEEPQWEVNLSFEFANLGPVSTRILLQDTLLSAHFWATERRTRQLIDSHLDQFKLQLKKSGFTLGQFACFEGQPINSAEPVTLLSDNLVDIEV